MAQDCRFSRGIVAPINASRPAFTLPSPARTLFKYGPQHWFAWPGTVSAIASPIAQDPWQRVYWTGEGKPRLTAQDMAIAPTVLARQPGMTWVFPGPIRRRW